MLKGHYYFIRIVSCCDLALCVFLCRIFNHPNVLPVLGACNQPPNLVVISQLMPFSSLYNVLHGETGQHHCHCYALLSSGWCMPSVPCHCWLGIGKSIRPVNIWVMRCWYLSGARCWLFAYGPADATANPKTQLSFASFKSKLVLPFWYQLNTRTLCVFDDRLMTHSSVVFGGQARIVYATLVYQIFTAWCYMLCIWAIEHLWHAISRKRLEIGIYFCWHEKQEITSSIQWHRF